MNYSSNGDAIYKDCTLCPRSCHVNRLQAKIGFCGQTTKIKLACVCLHMGEEPPISGKSGSGTVFFCGCTLKCAFCQNMQISRAVLGAEVSVKELATLFIKLQEDGAENINLVTGTHFVPGIIQAIKKAHNLKIPIVWNTSGYETPDTIRTLNPYVDIFLADLKTISAHIAKILFRSADYPEYAKNALKLMVKLKPLEWQAKKLVQGVIIRHLMLPGMLESTEQVIRWFAENLKGKAILSLMCQFLPVSKLAAKEKISQNQYYNNLNRVISKREYERVLGWLTDYSIEQGFIQDLADDTEWAPDFKLDNSFPEQYSRMIWHYRTGYVTPGK